ncbi:MAG TPA: polyphenol oxidase family protein [Candidatus Anoxymicrobiaceae bacterium]|jgi:YfiH family protein
MERETRGGVQVLSVPGLEEESGVRVAFTSRLGGSSSGTLGSLNLSYNIDDRPDLVAANREAVAQALGVPVRRWVLCRQVHGTAVADAGWLDAGRGAFDHRSGLPRTDALVTAVPGLLVGVLTADCVPLILVEPSTPSVAVVHAGWRGVLAGIALRAAFRLAVRSGVGAGNFVALIGPHIGPCCLEVGADVASMFRSEFGNGIVAGKERQTLDLRAATKKQLLSAGLKKSNVIDTGTCTACSGDYFSFRRDGVCGRQGAFAAVVTGSRRG